jgi:hypothetical protein
MYQEPATIALKNDVFFLMHLRICFGIFQAMTGFGPVQTKPNAENQGPGPIVGPKIRPYPSQVEEMFVSPWAGFFNNSEKTDARPSLAQ